VTAPTEEPSSAASSERLAAIVFGVAVAVAAVLYLRIGARNWFFLDEWDFLAVRSLSPRDLLEPHNEHWSTLPIIAYRVLWRIFGLRSYLPYVLPVVALHLTAATLLRAVIRRSGVEPWLATAAALLFLFLGTGFSDIIWAFQIGFTGSLVAGLAHLLLADHDGPADLRDAAGLGFGLVGLLCSGISVTMVGVVGLAVLVRRGWRMAALHTVPLAVVFGLWYVAFGSDAATTARPGPARLVDFVQHALVHTVRSVGAADVVAVALVAVLVVGGAVAVRDRGRPDANRSFAPWALLAGALVLAVITGVGRAQDLGVESAEASRYVHLLGAMTIPAIAAAGQALGRRSRWAIPIVSIILLAGIPGNIAEISTRNTFEEALLRGEPDYVRSLAHVAGTSDLPGRLEPDRAKLPGVTLGWLRQAVRHDKIELVRPVTDSEVAVARTRFLLAQETRPDDPKGCRTLDGPKRIELDAGDAIRFDDGQLLVRLVTDDTPGPDTSFRSIFGTALVAQRPIAVEVRPPALPPGVELCR
jgi:hypothetical protein